MALGALFVTDGGTFLFTPYANDFVFSILGGKQLLGISQRFGAQRDALMHPIGRID